jgi:hypothetical protein
VVEGGEAAPDGREISLLYIHVYHHRDFGVQLEENPM